MSVFERILDKARTVPKRIVLAEGNDPRVIEAAARAGREGIADIVLLGNQQGILDAGAALGIPVGDIESIDPVMAGNRPEYAEILFQVRAHKGMTREQAFETVTDPLCYANIMTRNSDVDGCVAGARYSSSDVVRAALQLIGKHPAFETVSSFFIMIFEEPFHKIQGGLIFADCGLIIEPDADQLGEIAAVSADSAQQLLGMDPRVALLSFSTAGSARHALVDKVVAATKRAKSLRPSITFVGDVQLDAALIPHILERKSDTMRMDAPANVFIFPGLEAGNIGYKIAERLGGAQAIGPILQGLKNPANDLSRGCNTDDIYKLIAVTAVQAQSKN